MTEAALAYQRIGHGIEGAEESQMFGKPCFKIGGKAFISFFGDEMVFKLLGSAHTTAINLDGAKLFDPSGKERPMKEWVQVPFAHATGWKALADEALAYARATKHRKQ
ncbi:MAG: hypothetical protein EOP49_37820 [Sphingobacteriales bacterium]|nr:MAG: hypothetical protein EOP49_37820 [Sphingobacteriales bacterium]